MTDVHFAALVPELSCSNFQTSLTFYKDKLGFKIIYGRSENGFACIALGHAQIMLEQSNGFWSTGELHKPYGRGINFQILVENVESLYEYVINQGVPVFAHLETSWYRIDQIEHGQSEFLVQDPDGYLLRFSEHLDEQPVV